MFAQFSSSPNKFYRSNVTAMQRATTLAASTRQGEKNCETGLRPVSRLNQPTAHSSKRASLSPKKAFKSEGISSKSIKEEVSVAPKVVRVKAPGKKKVVKEVAPPTRCSKRVANYTKQAHKDTKKE